MSGRLPALVNDLASVVGRAHVQHAPEDMLAYEYDYGLDRGRPELAVFPGSAEEVAGVVRVARLHGMPIVPRGAGTGISGGAVPARGGLVLALTRMRRVLRVDPDNRLAVVEPGVVNLDISRAAEPYGLYFAPDPSSQKASTVGGNVANNAGGPHCLAYGVTANHILGLQVVFCDGALYMLGSEALEGAGYDLRGLLIGSEGTLGIVTQVTVRLLRRAEAVHTLLAVFEQVRQASASVSEVIAQGILPAAMEMMDGLALKAIEAAFRAGYPPGAGAVLLIELEGLAEELAELAPRVEGVCRAHGAVEVRRAASAEARARLWAGRKGAASAMGRLAPNYSLHDAVVPRTLLPAVLDRIVEIAERHRLPIANLFHAGDGNLHPMILFDQRQPGVLERVLQAGREILAVCVEAGGTITGEHGVGLEKQPFMPWIFSQADLGVMQAVRSAIDPTGLLNPDKIFPAPSACQDVFARPPARVLGPELWI